MGAISDGLSASVLRPPSASPLPSAAPSCTWQVFDCTQSLTAGCFRGMGKQTLVALLNFAGYDTQRITSSVSVDAVGLPEFAFCLARPPRDEHVTRT